MTPAYSDPLVTLYEGDCLDVMRELPDASVDAVVTDPPYGIQFMGRHWDHGVPGVDFWREMLRVLKPGGYLLSFAGTRTVHRFGVAIEDAGFEIRDTLMWIYASGFPKSLDVSKALDRQRTDDDAILAVTAFVRAGRDAMSLDNDLIDSRLGYKGMAHWWTFDKRRAGPRSHGGAAVPNLEQWAQLKALLHLGPEMDAEVWRLNGVKGKPGPFWEMREVLAERERKATGRMAQGEGGYAFGEKFTDTAPATDLARKWEGWGTALKPAHEPIVMARKPLVGTVAQNVSRFGTGALNIGAARIGTSPDDRDVNRPADNRPYAGDNGYGPSDTDGWSGNWSKRGATHAAGRWPSNVLLSSPELFDEPNPGVVGAGPNPGSIRPPVTAGKEQGPGLYEGRIGVKAEGDQYVGYGDSGGYSRFFRIPSRIIEPCPHCGAEAYDRVYQDDEGVARHVDCGLPVATRDYPTAYLIPKADRAERERGLQEIALRLHRERGECDKLRAWESADQSPSDPTASTSPARDTSEVTPPTTPTASSSDTSAPGKPSTGRSPRATRSTTSTGTRPTTASTISSSLTPPPTSESTPGASLSMGFGGSPAESASSSDPSSPSGGTSRRKAGPSMADADPATSARWSKPNVCGDCGKPLPRGSSHPTVKPIDLMRHLVRLVTPPGGVCLDPFAGSGTTALACSEEGFRNISIEREPEYIEIAVGRLMATPMGLGLDVPAPVQKRSGKGSMEEIRAKGYKHNVNRKPTDRLDTNWTQWREGMQNGDEEPAA